MRLHILHFSPKHAAKIAEKVLRSAVSNLQNKDEGGRIEPEDMVVKEAFVDGGMTDEADYSRTDGARVPDSETIESRDHCCRREQSARKASPKARQKKAAAPKHP